MNQQPHPARARGLRRAALITTGLAAAGVVGAGSVAVLAHSETLAKTTSATTPTTANSTSTSSNNSSSNSGSVSAGIGAAPQAQSAGS
ncbi:MAG TPA: hypothetical protein VF892_24065 [Pseudonocardiaceae bacterium]